jgi:hypothetical protein
VFLGMMGMNVCSAVWSTYDVSYMDVNFCYTVWSCVFGYEVLYLGMNVCSAVWSCVSRYKVLYLSLKFSLRLSTFVPTSLYSFVPGYKIMFLIMKLWRFEPRHKVMFLSMMLYISIWRFVPRYKVMFLSMILCVRIWSFVPRFKVSAWPRFASPSKDKNLADGQIWKKHIFNPQKTLRKPRLYISTGVDLYAGHTKLSFVKST